MFEFEHKLRYSDYKDFDTVKVSTALELIQEAAIQDSDQFGYSIDKLREMNLAWLLLGYNVHFEKPISTKYPITTFTAVKNMKAATSVRGAKLLQNGEVIGKSIANWFMFDTNKMRPGRIPEEMLTCYGFYDFNDDFFDYKKPEILEIEEPAYTIRVSNKDIDTNMHLNNVKGAELLMDALPFDFFFTDMSIIYKNQSRLGDVLGVCVKELDNGYYVHLETEDRNVCVAATFLKN